MSRAKRIKDLPPSTRPLEKLLEKGPANLTDVELLALLLGTGKKGKNVLSLAKSLLADFGWEKLSQAKASGVGKMKTARIAASLELGKRLFREQSAAKPVIQTSDDILAQVRDIIGKKQEYIIVLYVNARHELIHKETVGIGSLNANVIEPREIFRHAFIQPCAGIFVIHNHPSGDPSPSDADILFTKRIQKAGEVLGILLFDHVIVGQKGVFSFRSG